MGNYRCQVCGEITWCHSADEHMAKQIEAARNEYEAAQAQRTEEPAEEPAVEPQKQPTIKRFDRTQRIKRER